MKLEQKLKPEDAGWKVRDVLKREYPFSAHAVRWLKFNASIYIDNKLCKASDLIPAGASSITVEMQSPNEDAASKHPQQGLEIAYEDQYLLVVYKPAGLAVHASSSRSKDTLCDKIKKYLDYPDVYPVGRLDQEVAGFMVFGKNFLSASMLEMEQKAGQIKKTYLALCHNPWKEEELSGDITAPIEKTGEFNRYRTSPSGKPALSHYRVLENTDASSLVEVSIETGRTHQIRLHMKYAGHEIYGDQYYGLEDGIPHCQLCAYKLSVLHPITKETMLFCRENPLLPLPETDSGTI